MSHFASSAIDALDVAIERSPVRTRPNVARSSSDAATMSPAIASSPPRLALANAWSTIWSGAVVVHRMGFGGAGGAAGVAGPGAGFPGAPPFFPVTGAPEGPFGTGSFITGPFFASGFFPAAGCASAPAGSATSAMSPMHCAADAAARSRIRRLTVLHPASRQALDFMRLPSAVATHSAGAMGARGVATART